MRSPQEMLYDLRKPSSNKQAAKEFMAKSPKQYFVIGLEFPDGFKLVSQSKGKKIRLVDVRNSTEPRIVYAVDIEVSDKKVASKSCINIDVFCHSSYEHVTHGLPDKIINLLINNYVILIDSFGDLNRMRTFWEDRICKAIYAGLYVYSLGGKSSVRIMACDDFFESYGSSEAMFAISSSEL